MAYVKRAEGESIRMKLSAQGFLRYFGEIDEVYYLRNHLSVHIADSVMPTQVKRATERRPYL